MANVKTTPFMGRGTTPSIRFAFPYSEDEVSKVYVSFKGIEENSGFLEKRYIKGSTNADDKGVTFVTVGSNKYIEVNLTQKDTLESGFKENQKIMMSIKALLADGETVPYCPPMYTYMGQVLKKDIL